MFYDFPETVWNVIPTDFHSMIFQRGRAQNHQAVIFSFPRGAPTNGELILVTQSLWWSSPRSCVPGNQSSSHDGFQWKIIVEMVFINLKY